MPPFSDKLHKVDNSESTASSESSTPVTSTSSSPSFYASTPPKLHQSFVPLQLNDAVAQLADENDVDNIASPSKVVVAAPASKKSLRTHNPIRAIVDPIMAHSVKCGKERGDGKDQISLAVSTS